MYGISNKKTRNNKRIQGYIIYLGFILGIEIIILSSIYILDSETTQSLYPFYVTGEFFILISFFLTELKATKKWQIMTRLIAGYIFIETTIQWYINDDASNGIGKIISHLTIICLAAILLIKNIKELETNNPLSIIYATLFLYYGVSLFLFLIMNQLTEMNISIWIINNILSSILYGSSIYTFYRLKKW
ncbi:MAG: hypothetical protein COB60_12805 [Flavobacteriaceae bacterium]|nr:MAG: hypothetical protein COB60_12805 [Flavobacteriaceae bacterium]